MSITISATKKRKRYFLPREHGAYAQLLFPLLSGLLLGTPTIPAAGFTIAAVIFFLAHEPLAVMLGHRGTRLREELGLAARQRFFWLCLVGCLVGASALLGATFEARQLALIPAGLAIVLIPFVQAKKLKTLTAEMIAIAAFACLHLPIGHSSGLRSIMLWGPALVWFVSFATATLTVHAIKARQQHRDSFLIKAALISSTLAVVISLEFVFWGGQSNFRPLGLAILMPAAAVLAVNLLQVRPGSLMHVGWSLALANAAALVMLIGGFKFA